MSKTPWLPPHLLVTLQTAYGYMHRVLLQQTASYIQPMMVDLSTTSVIHKVQHRRNILANKQETTRGELLKQSVACKVFFMPKQRR